MLVLDVLKQRCGVLIEVAKDNATSRNCFCESMGLARLVACRGVPGSIHLQHYLQGEISEKALKNLDDGFR